MGLENCPKCGGIFLNNGLRDICNDCFKDEEKKYDEVYKFLRVRENRAATIEQICEATGVEEDLLYKWVKRGRLQTALFKNIGYPCEKCGTIIREGKLCESCAKGIIQELDLFERERRRREEDRGAYLSMNRKLKDD